MKSRLLLILLLTWLPSLASAADRPAECPKRYCGCAVSLKLFGKVVPKLNNAWNWQKTFPRAFPAPGMVAARHGHVMLLLAHHNGNEWVVFDPNSGHGLTREHVRSIAGFTIVNPRGKPWAA